MLTGGSHPLVSDERALFSLRPVRVLATRMDAGWLFVLAGLALLSATWLIPALDGLARAERERDVARSVASWHGERLRRYSDFLSSIDAADPAVLRSLAATQLNLAPTASEAIAVLDEPGVDSASVFDRLTPTFEMPPTSDPRRSALGDVARDPSGQRWLFAGGVMLTLIGLVGFRSSVSGGQRSALGGGAYAQRATDRV